MVQLPRFGLKVHTTEAMLFVNLNEPQDPCMLCQQSDNTANLIRISQLTISIRNIYRTVNNILTYSKN